MNAFQQFCKSYLFLVSFLIPAIGLAADNYPNKPIRLIVPFEAGGTSDTTARMMAKKLEQRLKTSIVVENKPGANGAIATAFVARSLADGYTLLHTTPAFIINPLLNKKLGYDVFKDFAPITNLAMGTGYVMVVNSALPAKNLQEFINYGKTNKISYSSPGVGNALHLASAQFTEYTGLNALHIPYKGTSPALLAVASGEVDFMILPPTIVHSFISSGKVRAVAFTDAQRSPDFPNLPTMQESGLKDLNIAGTWLGWFAPAKTPQPITQQIAQEIKNVLQDPEMIEFLTTSGFRADGRNPSDFDKFVKSESKRIEAVLKNVTLNE
ncbi:Bug family tripartite tricarboxylate transporter substrate binding protein [Polynucleobacter rarus]|uniref:Bug family tripartite tricarboxylate transporter substrate binding protein n=1 Tax=Polynucleobacter rarus TaxID=556055 RepID=UPI000D3E0AED|nr:tripartite tricarboxylate transporter substrate binding protein [Polynucleobacter rarus]